jgi:nucleotide-binding universal stress UspA family protein
MLCDASHSCVRPDPVTGVGIDESGGVFETLELQPKGRYPMKRKILIPIDGSECALRAAEYVGDILCQNSGCELTLFYVCTRSPGFRQFRNPMETTPKHERNSATDSEDLRCYESCRRRVEDLILAPVKKVLEHKLGSPASVEIHTKVAAGSEDQVAAEIIEEVKRGGYDTMVLGKWGTRMLTAFVWGEVTSKVVHRVQGCNIWIVDNSLTETKRDGSVESMEERNKPCVSVS